ncbi:hypothetical protein EYZ11_012033 [Aspergillus tanneri]|uniref:Uncharacterized protein n=1 Tax=Aspergillus tanneri TaxID=1220188 RepID=A0A4S3J196_9EURO|nr:hypothetical protein EYZ11_012033 [Aspergillus tanneri]
MASNGRDSHRSDAIFLTSLNLTTIATTIPRITDEFSSLSGVA